VKESGLAMADVVRFPGTYEVGIDANIVNGQHIAGIIRIAQDPLTQFPVSLRRSTMPTACSTLTGKESSSMIRNNHQRSESRWLADGRHSYQGPRIAPAIA